MKKKILIIGFGNIGYRHAESLLSKNYSIFIVDPKKTNFDKIPKLYKKKIIYYKKIEEINEKNFDLLISATNSNIRYNTTIDVVKKFKIKNIIFEKFVFTKENEFYKMLRILEEQKIKAWVNCPLRVMSVFKKIKKKFKKNDDLIINVVGSNWNMASNSIHYLDLYNYFVESKFNNFENKLLKKSYQSKRKGFFELYGFIKFNVNEKNYLTLENHNKKNKLSVVVKFDNHKFNLYINNASKIIKYYYKNKLVNKNSFFFEKQSNMTSKLVSNIFLKKSPGLITFESSIHLHLQFLKMLKYHSTYNLNTKNYPIT